MKREVIERVDLADRIGCLLMPKLRYLWRFSCGHEELRSHRTVGGNGAFWDKNGVCHSFGICKQCTCCS